MDEQSYEERALAEDMAIGGVSLETITPTRFPHTGATQTQSTDYRLLDAMFGAVPLRNDDIFLDVGCGEGRVLSYLYLHGFTGRLIGVELDPDVAEIARARLSAIDAIEVLAGNVFDAPELVCNASAAFLFNPFDGDATLDFIELVERVSCAPFRLYYCGDYYRTLLDGRPGWALLARDEVDRAGAKPLSYSIYAFAQNEIRHEA